MVDATTLDGHTGQDTPPSVSGAEPSPDKAHDRLWAGTRGRILTGVFALTFLEAFEAMAVSTAMPAVARDLHAVGAVALAFSVPLAVSVVAMSVAGGSTDRRGPGPVLRLGVALFVGGLLAVGLAPTMPVFLAGRALQGYATGLTGVGLLVLVGRTFPDHLRARVFSVMAGAWVLPALVGPGATGIVAEQLGWRWVFLAVPPLALAALALLRSALRPGADGRHTATAPPADPGARGRRPAVGRRALGWSIPLSVALLVTSVAGQAGPVAGPALLVAGLAVVVVAAPRLLPAGTWTGRRGLPSTLSARSLVAAGNLSAGAYLPLAVVEYQGLTLTEAGLLLTASAVTWSGAAWLGAHAPALASPTLRVRLGTACVVGGAAATGLALVPHVPIWLLAVLWTLTGFGMGLSNPTFAVLTLAASAPAQQGANGAVMQTNDVVVQSLVLALGAAVFAALVDTAPTRAFVAVTALAVLSAAAGLALTFRLGPRRREVLPVAV